MGPEIIWGLGLSYLAISTIIENLPGKYKVRKISKSGILKHKIEISEINHLPLDECLKFGENNEVIREFYQTLESKLAHCDLSAFYSNMDSLKINSSEDSFLLKLLNAVSGTVAGGVYFSTTNKIHVDSNPLGRSTLKKHVLTHELLHMASSRRDKNYVFSGFCITGKNESIGRGLNEGYTELLNGRYFGVNKSCDSYFDLQMLVVGIESIVGQEQMEQAYFTNDVNFIIQELGKYSSNEDAMALLVKIDTLLRIRNRSESKRAKRLESDIRMDIVKLKLEKLKRQRDTGEISEKEYMRGVYSQELYVNGYVAFRQKDELGKVVNNFISSGPLMGFGYIEMSSEDYDKHASEYYSSFLENGCFDSDTWKNKYGISTRKMIDARFNAKRRERLNVMEKKLNINAHGFSELDDMFIVRKEYPSTGKIIK